MKNKEDPGKRMIAAIILFLILIATLNLFSSNKPVTVSIKIKEKNTGVPVSYCSISISNNKDPVKNVVTDLDGNSNILLDTGEYIIKATSVGYQEKSQRIRITEKNKSFSIELEERVFLKEVIVEDYKIPLIDRGTASHMSTYDRDEIHAMPTREVNSMAVKVAGVVRGSRDDATTYRYSGESIKIIEGGIPADYGDIEGGIIKLSKGDKPEKSETTKSDKQEGYELYQNKLTAGEINDFSKWKLWENESSTELQLISENFGVQTGKRFCFNVIDQNGSGIIDARIRITGGSNHFTSHSDNKGVAECWLNDSSNTNLSAEVFYNDKIIKIENIIPFEKGINTIKIDKPCEVPDIFDLAFVVDATGSMSDEIEYLKSEMLGLINNIKSENNSLVVRVATVFYRDNDDEYVTRASDFTTNLDSALLFIKNNSADGGGDTPEAMETGMIEAGKLNWSTNARTRIAFLIADAPPHNEAVNREGLKNVIQSFSSNGIRIVPIACSGVTKSTELLMRNLALLTNGTYLYLTDHSNVGDIHIKPTTDKLDHKKLNALLKSVIKRFTRAQTCSSEQHEIATDSTNDSIPLIQPVEDEIKEMITENNFKLNEKISLSPNPATDRVTIKTEWKINEILIYNINGKAIRKYQVDSEKYTDIKLDEFATGEYVVRVLGKSKSGCGKLLIRR